MSRIVSVWLPRWPIYRFLAAQTISSAGKPVDPERPFVLAIPATGGLRIAAMNEAAEIAGIVIGDPVADARAKADSLQVRAADSSADDAALRRLALWATRYTSTASVCRRGLPLPRRRAWPGLCHTLRRRPDRSCPRAMKRQRFRQCRSKHCG